MQSHQLIVKIYTDLKQTQGMFSEQYLVMFILLSSKMKLITYVVTKHH